MDEVNVKTVENGKNISLDKTLTDELLEEGLAREIVRAVQVARKQAGLDVDDRIHLSMSIKVSEKWRDFVMEESLADDLHQDENYNFDTIAKINNENVTISLEKA